VKVLFLFAKSFSFTGGIEKFNQCFLKALNEITGTGFKLIDGYAISLYEKNSDDRYVAKERFRFWGGNKIFFLLDAFLSALNKDVLIISHINFSLIPFLVKLIMPSKKIIVIVHGIEVWKSFTGIKRKLLQRADMILSVSEFTKQQLLSYNDCIDEKRIHIFPNTIDPYFSIPPTLKKPEYLLERYGLKNTNQILVSVTRISSEEKYKGYDTVIESIALLKDSFPDLRYLICGKYDSLEKERIEKLMDSYGLKDTVMLTGFIEETELTDHYLLSDIFILPSKGEGFGIAFLEAQACGRKIIAGNKDGSREALLNTASNRLINPDDAIEIKETIISLLGEEYDPVTIQRAVIERYGFVHFKNKLTDYLSSLN